MVIGTGADQVEGFDVFVGAERGLARRIGYRAPADQMADALQRLLEAYLDDREPAESFRQWAGRTTDFAIKTALSGYEAKP